MARPGTTLTRSSQPATREARTATGPAFIVGLTGKGTKADAKTPARDMGEWTDRFGARADSPFLYDTAEGYFNDGGAELFTSRVFGPAAGDPNTFSGIASLNITDAGAGVSLIARATSPGSWANGATGGVSVDIDAGGGAGTFVVKVYLGGVLQETSPDLADQAAAITWAANSDYIRLYLGATALDPAPLGAAANLTGGTDDRANETAATRDDAHAQFTRDLGPGQLAEPGMTTAVAHARLARWGKLGNRIGIPDGPDTGSKTTLLGVRPAVAALVTTDELRYLAEAFAPWPVVEGSTSGTTKTIPPSSLVLAAISRNDGAGITPNQPAAGDLGQSDIAVRLSQPGWSDADRTDLNAGGINLLREVYGGVRVYGFRTMASPVTDPEWINLAQARLFMAIQAEGEAIAETFVFRMIDGRRHTINEYIGELTGMLLPYWQSGALFGDTPSEAFTVSDTNTNDTIRDGFLKASVGLTMSEFAEEVVLDLVKQRIGEGATA